VGQSTCSEDECGRPHYARGWCQRHYDRARRGIDPGVPRDLRYRDPAADRECTVPGCTSDRVARGWCVKHYKRWKKTGDPGPAGKPPKAAPKSCSQKDCPFPAWARGLCGTHYGRWHKHGDPNAVTRRLRPVDERPDAPTRQRRLTDLGPFCAIEDCGRSRKQSSDLCSGHAERLRLKGIRGGPLNVRNARPDRCTDGDCPEPVQARGLCAAHYMRWLTGSVVTGPIGPPGRVPLPRHTRNCRLCHKPVERLHSNIYVICSDCRTKGRKPHRNYYGKTWQAARKVVRERDRGLCRSCGIPEAGKQHAVAHVIPFDVGLAMGWSESMIHNPANLLLLCQKCHIRYDRQEGWAFDPIEGVRPEAPDWASEFRVSDLVTYAAEIIAFYVPELLDEDQPPKGAGQRVAAAMAARGHVV